MPAVLLTILKIIGIIVLSIIALALFFIVIILFVPFRFRICADKARDTDDFYANVNVSYLLHIVSATLCYDRELIKRVRVFGIKIWPRNKEDKNTSPKKDTGSEDSSSQIEESVNDDREEGSGDPQDFTIDWNDDDTPATDEENTGEGGLSEKIVKIIDNIVARFDSLSEKYDKIKKELRFWDKMINDSRNQHAVEVLKNQIIRLLRAVRPRKIKGFIHFGFEDPATCGKVLMYLSMIYPTLPRKLVFEPSFEDTDIYGDVVIKGRLFLIVVLVCLIRLYFNKDIKRMLGLYKRHRNR